MHDWQRWTLLVHMQEIEMYGCDFQQRINGYCVQRYSPTPASWTQGLPRQSIGETTATSIYTSFSSLSL